MRQEKKQRKEINNEKLIKLGNIGRIKKRRK